MTQETASLYPTIQSVLWATSVTMAQACDRFESYDEFYDYVLTNLPQNSPTTRRKYAGLVQRRFFPERSLHGLIPSVWRGYHDERILTDVMRVALLEAEPAVARFVLTQILSLTPGCTLPLDTVHGFIRETYGEFKYDSYKRLLTSCRDLGYLECYNGELVVEYIPAPADAFLILLHQRLAPSPRIVRLKDVLATEWWRFLGIRNPDDLRRILHQAADAGLVARFAKVDELEQVTTRYSGEAFLDQGMRL